MKPRAQKPGAAIYGALTGIGFVTLICQVSQTRIDPPAWSEPVKYFQNPETNNYHILTDSFMLQVLVL